MKWRYIFLGALVLILGVIVESLSQASLWPSWRFHDQETLLKALGSGKSRGFSHKSSQSSTFFESAQSRKDLKQSPNQYYDHDTHPYADIPPEQNPIFAVPWTDVDTKFAENPTNFLNLVGTDFQPARLVNIWLVLCFTMYMIVTQGYYLWTYGITFRRKPRPKPWLANLLGLPTNATSNSTSSSGSKAAALASKIMDVLESAVALPHLTFDEEKNTTITESKEAKKHITTGH